MLGDFRVLAVVLVVGLLIGGATAWYFLPRQVDTQVQVQTKEKIVIKREIVKPDGTVETITETKEDSTTPVFPPPAPKKDYSVTVTHPVDELDAGSVGVDIGRRLWHDVWGEIGWQRDQGIHVGVRVEF